MSDPNYSSGPTSNDLLERHIAENTLGALNYQIVAQNAEDLKNIENAPYISIRPHTFSSRDERTC